MALKSVLLTGATGSVGAFVLHQLLSNGNSVNAIVRSIQRSCPFLFQKYSSYLKTGALKITEIPDLTVPHAFDQVVRTVDAVIHVATPLAHSDFQHNLIDPTWTIDESILSAAMKSPSVKRVIITGSIVSTMKLPEDLMKAGVVSEENYNGITSEEGLVSAGAAYMYAKTMAERKSWAFMETYKPGFDLIVLLAPSITGRCIQGDFVPTKDRAGGMSSIYKSLFDVEQPGFLFPYFMDVEDVAAIHVRSLNLAVPGNQRYLFHAGTISANKLANKVRETYPELRHRVPLGREGDGFPEPMVECNISKFEKVFGSQWTGWWDSARGTVDDILKFESGASNVGWAIQS